MCCPPSARTINWAKLFADPFLDSQAKKLQLILHAHREKKYIAQTHLNTPKYKCKLPDKGLISALRGSYV